MKNAILALLKETNELFSFYIKDSKPAGTFGIVIKIIKNERARGRQKKEDRGMIWSKEMEWRGRKRQGIDIVYGA